MSLRERGPTEPPASTFEFPPASSADANGVVSVGGDLEPGTLLSAYRSGLFPMRVSSGELAWWSPDPRGILALDGLRISDSLRRSRRRFEIRVDSAFHAVLDACADRAPDEYAWITEQVKDAYARLHELGWAHSVEAWTTPTEDEPEELGGGLYGIAIGGLFAGESMFHRRRDASKAALAALVELLHTGSVDDRDRFVDIQWLTPHFVSLGAVEIPRDLFLAKLERALDLPLPTAFSPTE
jgi:leucyl/phenylalanyl-tRNA--protein transferase